MILPSWLEPLPDAAAMRALDAAAIAAGTSGTSLMARAGTALAEAADAALPEGPLAVLCGKGNNGGDGFVAARQLAARGREVRVLATAGAEDYAGDAAEALGRLDAPLLPFAADALDGVAGVVDCLLGTGATGAPHGAVAAAIAAVAERGLPVLACDVPSGVDASTGEVAGTAIRAGGTVTFAAAKPGLHIAPGKTHAGAVRVADIGLGPVPDAVIGQITDAVLAERPRRGAHSTKLSGGHVLVAGGSRGLTGAPCLSAIAAARAGAGYVTVLVPASLEAIFEIKLTEVMSRGLGDEDGHHLAAGADDVLDAAARAGALVLGPGLGRSSGAQAFARAVAAAAPVPLVLDADGLNAHAGRLGDLAAREHPTVLTPHEGELARLLEVDRDEVAARRLHHARAAAERAQAVVVLKGDDTLVAAHGGTVAVSPGGAPGLATAGTGDVLSGVLAALLAPGLDPFTAACAGVLAHLRAGQRAAAPHGPDAVIASDVVEALPAALAGALVG